MAMDNVDKKLFSVLVKNGRSSLSEIGKMLDMSHVAVSKRLEKLVEEDLLHVTAGINAEKLDIKIVFIGIETESTEVTERIREKYRNCPRLLMLAPVTGRYSLFAVIVVEDTWSLESVIGTCSIRTEPGVRRSECWFGNAPHFPKFLPIDLAPITSKKNAPCGRDCKDCKRYSIKKCVGCPATTAYKGVLWTSSRTKPRRKKRK